MARTGIKNYDTLIKNIRKMISEKSQYVYWYGGKDQKCTDKLLTQLSKQYPNIYTSEYIKNCKKDIINNKKCIDCSGLVCKVYNVPDVGTSQFDKYWKYWLPKSQTGVSHELMSGMILWRNGHCGICYDGMVLQAKGQKQDIVVTEYNRNEWQRVYYDPKITYTGRAYKSSRIRLQCYLVITGHYGNGSERINNLKKAGFDDVEIKYIQRCVNSWYKEANEHYNGDINAYMKSRGIIK